MRRPYSRLAAVSALAVAIASLTIGPAFAGGNPSAPGQQKKAADASSTAGTSSTAGSPSQGGNADASQPGMKPANNTAHGTSCTYQSSTTCTANQPATSQATAKQDASKHYGNNKTAAQIAASKGVPAGSTIYGPGNSQPHKPVCPGGKATFDVHALKAHGTAPGCASASVSSGGSVSGSASASVSSSGKAGVGAMASGGGKGSQGAFTPPSTTRNGGTSSQGAVAGTAHAAHPVLGAANFTG